MEEFLSKIWYTYIQRQGVYDMSEDQILLYDHKKPIPLSAKRVSFYLRGQIIEAFSETNEVYYLFFYKYNFLTAFKPTKLRRKSFIENAFKKGMVFNNDHPFIFALLSANQPFQMTSIKPLLKKLEKQYTPQEKTFILTFFESFIPKKQLFTEIQTTFYEFRRNGQMLLGYQIVRILMDFAPKNSWVKNLASDRSFSKLSVQYNEKSETLFAKDVIFAEKTLYGKKDDDRCFQQLVSSMEKENRWMDLIALYCYKLTETPLNDYYTPLKTLLEKHFNETEIDFILAELAAKIPTFLPIQEDLFNKYIEKKEIDKIINLMKNNEFKLSHSQVLTMGEILSNSDLSAQAIDEKTFFTLMSPVIVMFPEKAEKLLTKYIITLFKTKELADIKTGLMPFKKNKNTLVLFEKIDLMQKLNEDLDEMQILGELYYEFKQFDKAIECFSWEMELDGSNPKPLQWLAKVYRELGMNYESDAYRQQCINLQKHA